MTVRHFPFLPPQTKDKTLDIVRGNACYLLYRHFFPRFLAAFSFFISSNVSGGVLIICFKSTSNLSLFTRTGVSAIRLS